MCARQLDGLDTVLKYLLDNCPIPENVYTVREVYKSFQDLVASEKREKHRRMVGDVQTEVKVPDVPHHATYYLVHCNENIHQRGRDRS